MSWPIFINTLQAHTYSLIHTVKYIYNYLINFNMKKSSKKSPVTWLNDTTDLLYSTNKITKT